MKHIFLTMLLISITVQAKFRLPVETITREYQIETLNRAVITFCPEGMLGCAERIYVNGESYLIDPANEEAEKSLNHIRKQYIANKIYETEPGEVMGYVVKEKGHFPNPTVEFEVYKLLKLNFKLPN